MVLVIVILGILSSVIIPNDKKDIKEEASTQIISHIRYVQELALQDNKHRQDYDKKWQNGYWKWSWTNCNRDSGAFYTISSSKDLSSSVSKTDSMIDPSTGKYLYLNASYCGNRHSGADELKDIDLYKRFGIEKITGSGGCNVVQNVSFDYFGRPHSGTYSDTTIPFENLLYEDCILTFQYDIDKTFSITITAQTGYTYLKK